MRVIARTGTVGPTGHVAAVVTTVTRVRFWSLTPAVLADHEADYAPYGCTPLCDVTTYAEDHRRHLLGIPSIFGPEYWAGVVTERTVVP